VAAGTLFALSSRHAGRRIRDSRALSLGIGGAVLIFVSVFVEFESGSSMAGVGLEYALEPLVAVASIGAALVLTTVLGRPFIAGGLLFALGVLSTLRAIGVVVAAVGGGSAVRAAV
jgi:hypothetical protein